jgi:hypothetical protein
MPTETEGEKPAAGKRCPGRKDKGCSSFVRDGSSHHQCRKCRCCNQADPCTKCLDKGPEHWKQLEAQGKHGDRATWGKKVMQVQLPLFTPDPKTVIAAITAKQKVKDSPQGGSSLRRESSRLKSVVAVPNTRKDTDHRAGSVSPPTQDLNGKTKPCKRSDHGLGEGVSVVGGVESDPRPLECAIPGFPGDAIRHLDGSVFFDCMDDTGGSWTFLAAAASAENNKGNQVFAKCTHFNQ